MTEIDTSLTATRRERDEWCDKFVKIRDEMLDHRRILALELAAELGKYGASCKAEDVVDRATLFFNFLA